jgi:hypothetical protein
MPTTTILNPRARATVNQLCTLMLEMNKLAHHSSQTSTYGHLSSAVTAFVVVETGIDISNEDWNLGGSYEHATDIQQAIKDAVDRASEASAYDRQRAEDAAFEAKCRQADVAMGD